MALKANNISLIILKGEDHRCIIFNIDKSEGHFIPILDKYVPQRAHYQFSPATSTNRRIRSQNVLIFSFDPFCKLM